MSTCVLVCVRGWLAACRLPAVHTRARTAHSPPPPQRSHPPHYVPRAWHRPTLDRGGARPCGAAACGGKGQQPPGVSSGEHMRACMRAWLAGCMSPPRRAHEGTARPPLPHYSHAPTFKRRVRGACPPLSRLGRAGRLRVVASKGQRPPGVSSGEHMRACMRAWLAGCMPPPRRAHEGTARPPLSRAPTFKRRVRGACPPLSPWTGAALGRAGRLRVVARGSGRLA